MFAIFFFFLIRPPESVEFCGVLTKCYPWLRNSPGGFINIDIGVVGFSWIYNQPEEWFPFDNWGNNLQTVVEWQRLSNESIILGGQTYIPEKQTNRKDEYI